MAILIDYAPPKRVGRELIDDSHVFSTLEGAAGHLELLQLARRLGINRRRVRYGSILVRSREVRAAVEAGARVGTADEIRALVRPTEART